ncbi:MAG: recombination regulator RecX [Clostridium sp.]
MNIITKIEVQKRNKERVNIYIDEDYAFAISAELVYKYDLKVKSKVDTETLKEVAEKEAIMKCRNSAIRVVERSYKSEKELYDKLKEKGYEDKAINLAIEFLKEYNFINDETYTKSYIKDKIKTQGQKKILYTLKRKGIDEELIKDNLLAIDKEDEKEVAFTLAEKKYNILIKRESDKYKISQKLYRYLLSRGYEFSIAQEAIKKITNIENEY